MIGGPLVRNRTFFFANYEGLRQIERALTFASVPTDALRRGEMGKPIVNPYTGEIYADGVIPDSAITPFARAVLAGVPPSTRSGVSNNFDSLPREQLFSDKFDVKIDQQLAPGTSTFVRFSHRKSDAFEPPALPGEIGSPSNADVHILNQQWALGLTHIVSSRSLFEVRVGISRTDAGKTALGTGSPNMLEAYGIPGLPTDAVFSGGLTTQNVSGWTSWGRQSSNPQFQNPLAVDARFNMGARSSYGLVNPFVFNLRQRMHFVYLQDDWRVSPSLTLNLGVRYEYATPQWEADNFLTNFDPAAQTLIQAQDGSIADRALVNPDRNNWAPRLGLAYSLSDRTVVRTAYGVSYVHFNRPGGENLLSFNGPHVVPVTISQQPSQGLCTPDAAPTTCFRPTPLGYPAGLNDPGHFNPLAGRVNYIPPDTRTGHVHSWHVSVQRELGRLFVADVAYVGNRSRNLVILGDFNQARPNAEGENTPVQQRRPIQGYSFIQAAFDGGKGDYHALQVKIERRYSRGVYLLNSFTWSRARDNASGHLEAQGGDNSRVNMANLEGEFGLSGYNEPLNNTTTLVWELPFGRDRRWARSMGPAIEALAGGWRLSVINTMTSGRPVNLTYSPSSAQSVGGTASLRPNLTGDVYADDPGPDQYFNPANVVVPASVSQPFGNAPRNVARGPAIHTLDLGLHKTVGLGEGPARLELRIEAFNMLNRANFGSPNGNRSSTAFGTISSLATTPRAGAARGESGFLTRQGA